MRIEGTLTQWNDDRGFGFVTPAHGGEAIFVHISAFPKDASRPVIGEALTFEIAVDARGKKRAERVACSSRKSPGARVERSSRRRPGRSGGILGRVLPVALLGVAIWFGVNAYQARQQKPAFPSPAVGQPSVTSTGSASYRCDGRTHCNQMTSCEEAKWFLQHCPNTQMDGNRDGVPCESQWCR